MDLSYKDHLPELKASLAGELYDDPLQLGIYATDASNYQILPLAIVLPKHEEDVIQIMKWAHRYHVPVMARGGGTSLVGQTVAEALIIDFTKYMDALIEFRAEEQWAWVQPGMVRDVLNQQLVKHKLHFAPDPATTSRATVGGMIANNSSGTRSILYGKTIDHVIELEVLLDEGTRIQCKELEPHELEAKLEQKDREGELYRSLFEEVRQNREEIIARFPKVMRRVGGYNLDEFLGERWNLSRLFTGSECTLGLILKAKIRLEPTPAHQSLCIVHFNDFFDSIAQVAEMVSFSPASVELLDHLLIEKSRENLDTRRYCDFIEGDPGGVLVVEFYGDRPNDAREKAQALSAHLQAKGIGYAWPVIMEKEKIEAVFTVRKKGLGLLMGVKGRRKPIAFIEDAAVPLEFLSPYIRDVFQICRDQGVPVVAYAHASVGLLHVKPLLDLRDPEDIERMKIISDKTLERVLHYGGSWSGEHGDGLARSPYNERFFGTRLYQAFCRLKTAFDPLHLLNPGKIVHAPAVDSHLRYGPLYRDREFQSMFHYRAEGGFQDAVHLCNGVGECRKQSGGTMCPSYRATREEKDTTRGRANILRLAMSGQLDDYGMDSPVLQDVMDLCLSCKACKSECPSNVDMAKLKSEVLHHQQKKNGLKLSDRLILLQDLLGKINAEYFSAAVNPLLKNSWFRRGLESLTGFDRKRILPLYQKSDFIGREDQPVEGKANQVVLFADTYIKYHEAGIGISAKRLLEKLGFEVLVFGNGCCQRPALSKGLLDAARSRGEATFQKLKKYLDADLPVVFCEPSCASALKDDIPDLLSDPKWEEYSDRLFLMEDFLVQHCTPDELRENMEWTSGNYLLHGHCHQKALFGTQSLHRLFELQDHIKVREIPSGCCGMAGSFGYEKKHYAVSETIARTTLIPAIDASPEHTHIVATGFSCRHQIEHFAEKSGKHWLEYLLP